MIGTLGTFSGPAGEIFKGAAEGVSVWVKWINAGGGVNGHPVEHIVADDGGDAARHRAAERDLVENRKARAIVFKGEGFTNFSGPDPYVVEHRIPVVGTLQALEYDNQSSFYFPQGTAGEAFQVATWLGPASEIALPQGKKRLATATCIESTICKQSDSVFQRYSSQFGFESVYRAQISITQPDYTAECLSARNAGADVFFLGMDDKSTSRFASSCARQGYRPLFFITATTALPTLQENPNADGIIVGTAVFPWKASDNPARREFQEAMATYLPGRPTSGAHATGWVAAKLFEAGTTALPEPPTSEAILQGLWGIKNNDLGGLTSPLSFAADRGAERHTCWGVIILKDGQYTAPRGGDLRCR